MKLRVGFFRCEVDVMVEEAGVGGLFGSLCRSQDKGVKVAVFN
jgi:hypothetical protein